MQINDSIKIKIVVCKCLFLLIVFLLLLSPATLRMARHYKTKVNTMEVCDTIGIIEPQGTGKTQS